MKQVKTTWRGIRPVLEHNSRLCDPTDDYTRRIKAITSKGSKKLTESDHEQRDFLEWCGGLYWDEKQGLVMPSTNIESCIQSGAKKSRLGKDFAAAVLLDDDQIVFEHAKPKLTKEKLFELPEYVYRCAVKVQQARLMRVRPMVPSGWKLAFTVTFDDRIVNPKALHTAMLDAGCYCGLGDFRPKFGRFSVEEFKVL